MKHQGFTLIETLVYLGLFALIIGGLVSASYMLFETSDRNQTKAMMQEEGNYIMAKVVRALDNASSAAVSLGGSALTIAKYDSSSVVVDISGTDVRLDGAVLNNANVAVDTLLFIHSGGGASPESIEIGLTVSAKTPAGATIIQSASTTRYIRK